MAKISFQNNGISPRIKKPVELKKILCSIFPSEGYECSKVSYIFCKDDFLLTLNRQYLNHDTLTDIITFTLSGINMPIISEIFISVERVNENANKYGVSYLNELYRVMIHGILHLCGYSDHLPELKKIIRGKETAYLNLIDFT